MLKISDYFQELRLQKDSQVADFGCGNGKFAKEISHFVPEGKVFAIDVHKEKLDYLDDEVLKAGKQEGEKAHELQNIKTVWGDIESLNGTRLRDDSIDAIIIGDTFSLLKYKKVCIMEMKRVLKKKGKILFVDWHKHLGESVLHKNSVLIEEEVMKIFSELNFGVYPIIHKGAHQFVLLIEKR